MSSDTQCSLCTLPNGTKATSPCPVCLAYQHRLREGKLFIMTLGLYTAGLVALIAFLVWLSRVLTGETL